MGTEVVRVDDGGDFADAVRRAGEVLAGGGLAAFPTETVYGVASCVDHQDAVARLRRVKNRPSETAFTVHIGAREDAVRFAPDMGKLAARLIFRAWPGPLTLILPVESPAQAPVLDGLNGVAAEAMYYDGTIGLRCPDDRIAAALLTSLTSPVVAASANEAGQPPAQTGEDVLRDLDGKIDLLIDAGRTRYSRPSTIVRVTGKSYEVVREGVYDRRTLERLATLRLLFVCTGNTCRSPMAAGIASDALARRLGCEISELARHGVEVTSAGTAGGFGPAAEHAVAVMARRDIDISRHRSAALTEEMVQQADQIIVMTQAHREAVLNMVPSAAERVVLLLADRDMNDPIGGRQADYEGCARSIHEGVLVRLQEVMG